MYLVNVRISQNNLIGGDMPKVSMLSQNVLWPSLHLLMVFSDMIHSYH